jgi:sugar/nucleoside kinase (ribokinase family)
VKELPLASDLVVPDYLAFGDLGVDSVARVAHLPQPDEKLWVEPVGDFPGGMMGNAAVAVATLGVSAGVVAMVGADSRGDLVVDALGRRGVDTSYVIRLDAPSFWTLSLTVPSGQRTLIQFPTVAFGVDLDSFDLSLLARTRWVHTVAELGDTACRVLRDANEAGVQTSVDIEYPFVVQPGVSEMLPYVDVAFMNQAAAVALGGVERAARYVQECGASIVLVTLGEAGAYMLGRSRRSRELPASPVDAVDANGAGDAFAGAFAAGMLKGFDEDEAAELAILMAGRSTTALGGHGPEGRVSDIRATARAAGLPWWGRL